MRSISERRFSRVSISRNSRSRRSEIASSRALEVSRTRSISISAILPRFSAICASACPAAPCSRASSRCGVSTRVTSVSPLSSRVCWPLISRVRRSICSWVAACSASSPSFWLVIWRCCSSSCDSSSDCSSCAARRTAAAAPRPASRSPGWSAREVELGVEHRPRRARRARRSSRLFCASISNHWPSTVCSSGSSSSPSSSTSTSPALTSSPSRALIFLITPPIGMLDHLPVSLHLERAGAHHRARDAGDRAPGADAEDQHEERGIAENEQRPQPPAVARRGCAHPCASWPMRPATWA